MEISKKQIVLFSLLLLIMGGTITLVSGTKPEDVAKLWERVWKVEQPVEVTLDEPIDVTLDEPIGVTLDEPIEVNNPSNIELVHEEWFESVSFERIHLDDIGKYKHLYVYYAEYQDPENPDIDCKVYYELDEGNFHFIAGSLTGEVAGESPLKVEVASPVMEIWIDYTGIWTSFDHPVYVAVYGSSK
jgi:hypothetical protein